MRGAPLPCNPFGGDDRAPRCGNKCLAQSRDPAVRLRCHLILECSIKDANGARPNAPQRCERPLPHGVLIIGELSNPVLHLPRRDRGGTDVTLHMSDKLLRIRQKGADSLAGVRNAWRSKVIPRRLHIPASPSRRILPTASSRR